jgi:hypothetical protein
VSGSVDEWSDKFEKGEIDEGEGNKRRSVDLGEDVEEELGGGATFQGSVGKRDEERRGHGMGVEMCLTC